MGKKGTGDWVSLEKDSSPHRNVCAKPTITGEQRTRSRRPPTRAIISLGFPNPVRWVCNRTFLRISKLAHECLNVCRVLRNVALTEDDRFSRYEEGSVSQPPQCRCHQAFSAQRVSATFRTFVAGVPPGLSSPRVDRPPSAIGLAEGTIAANAARPSATLRFTSEQTHPRAAPRFLPLDTGSAGWACRQAQAASYVPSVYSRRRGGRCLSP